ncbi:MAG: UDP-2,4-diacetamido-2,4,6-trideoxy-beta-L-altropyranose hydrolase [Candidatus Methanoperedens sp.]|nr:UDP-2,4-diacetamido-2,4,6-trideoxy-beta-L-altropyranose hydrolase [Candidatus Methanoperedens sp.]
MRSRLDLPLLLVRADANATRGTGHVMRCLALADAWKARDGQVLFLSCRPEPPLRRRYETTGAAVIELEEPHPHATDLHATVAAVKRSMGPGKRSPWVALDGYHFDTTYQSALRSAGSHLMVIDDTAQLPYYDADVILNHALNAQSLAYACSADTRLLLGTQFALLRPEFQRWQHLERDCPEVAHKILVTLGGSDEGNATLKIVEALKQISDPHLDIRVVVGPLNPHLKELQRAIAPVSAQVRIETDVVDTAPLMAWADVAVAAGGTTSWELAFMKVPALVFTLAENQLGVAQAINQFGSARSLGFPESLSSDQIAGAVSQLMHDQLGRRRMTEKGRVLLDGQGVHRVLNALLHDTSDDDFQLRVATREDTLLLWQWANDPLARRNSFTSEPILWSQHELWYAGKIASPETRLWMMEYQHVPVGQIRYDRTEAKTARISFSIAPAYRGRKFGAKLLRLTADLAGRELSVCDVEGITFIENLASRRAFIDAGFEPIEEKNIAGHACAVFRRSCARISTGDSCASIH